MSHDESNTYKVDERLYDHLLDSDDEDARAPVPQENLISAASYIATIIADSGIRCGVLGGLGVALNGISRETRDVDIGIVSANWRAIRKALDQHLDSGRLKIPKSRMVAYNLRVFCRTGAPWDTCSAQHEIEVDLLSKPNAQEHDLDSTSHPPVFTLPALFRFKLLAYCHRGAQRDLDDMDAIVRKATPETILQSRTKFQNLGLDSDVIDDIDDEYVGLKQLLHKLLHPSDLNLVPPQQLGQHNAPHPGSDREPVVSPN